MDEQLAQDGRGFDAAAGGEAGEMVEQAAGPRLVLVPKIAGAAATVRPSRRSRSARPAMPSSGLASPTWKPAQQRLVRQPFERACIGPQGIAGMARKRAAGEHGEARQREPLRAADLASRRRVAKPPVRAGAGIEQHADDGEIELGARPRGAVAPAGGAGEARPAVRPSSTKCRHRE